MKGPWSQHRTHLDTKFSAQRRFNTLEGPILGGLPLDQTKTTVGVSAGVVFKEKKGKPVLG